MKKIIAMALAAALLTASLAGCNSDGGNNDTTTTTTQAPESQTTTEAQTTGEDTTNGSETPTGDVTAASILDAIKTAYGENYMPSMEVTSDVMDSMYGISEDLYTESASEMMMISTYPDTVLIFKAAEGKAGELETALTTLSDNNKASQITYPTSLPKVNAGKVVKNGDFVAYIMLGAVDDREDATDDEMAAFAEEQVQIGVDAFNSCF